MFNVLHIEDSPADTQLIKRHFDKQGVDVSLHRVDEREAILKALDGASWDAVLMDYGLPNLDFNETIELVAEHLPLTPLIVVAGSIGEEKVVGLLHRGAWGFVHKDNLGRLSQVFKRSLRESAERKARRAVEEALLESERRLALVQKGARLGIWDWDVAHDSFFWSNECASLYGIEPGRMRTYDEWYARVLPEDRPRVEAAWQSDILQGRNFEIEFRTRLDSGEIRWLLTKGLAQYDDLGNVTRLSGINLDITEQKRTEETLRTTLADLKEAQRVAHIGNWRRDASGRIDIWSEELYRILGRTEAAPPASDAELSAYYAPASWQRLAASLTDLLSEGRPFEHDAELSRADGHARWVTARGMATLDDQGRILEVHGTVQDITERKRIEQRLAESEMQYRAVIETSSDGFWVVGSEGRLLVVNDTYVMQSGFSREELLNMNVSELEALETPEDVQTRIEKVRRDGRDRFESRHRRKDGSIWPVEINVAYWAAAGGHQFVFVRDITDRKLAERALHETERLLAKAEDTERSRLAQDLHDDLGQLIALIKLKLSQLKTASLAPEQRKNVEDCSKAADLANRRIRSMAFQLSPPMLDEMGLVASLDWLADEMRYFYNLDVQVVDDGLPAIRDRVVNAALFRSVRELLLNVAKHAGVEDATVHLAGGGQNWLWITVADSGAGFDPGQLAQSKDENHYGLLSVRRRISHLGGRMDIRSVPGQGTMVWIIVPQGGTPEGAP